MFLIHGANSRLPQAASRKIHDMEHEATALRAEVESKDQELTLMQQRNQEAQTEIAELKAELENNAGKLMR